MKIEAETIEEFFVNSGEKEEAIREVDKIVTEMAPELERKLFAIPSITLLGYGEIPGIPKLSKIVSGLSSAWLLKKTISVSTSVSTRRAKLLPKSTINALAK